MTLRDKKKLTKPEIAGVCGRFARLKQQSKKPIGYSSLAEMAALAQYKKFLALIKAELEGLTVLGDDGIYAELIKAYPNQYTGDTTGWLSPKEKAFALGLIEAQLQHTKEEIERRLE